MDRPELPRNWFHLLESWADELNSRVNRVRLLIGDAHWGEEGTYKEALLRELLREFLPSKYRVSTGFVYWWDEGVSKQIDIIIWDSTDSTPLVQQGEFAILTQDDVKAIIEVKTTLRPDSLKSALNLLHPEQFYSWKWGHVPIDISGMVRTSPSIPLRCIFAFRNGLRKNTNCPGEACFEMVAEFYRERYRRDAVWMLARNTADRWRNFIDCICIADSFLVRQATILSQVVIKEPVARILPFQAGLVAVKTETEHGNLALAAFVLHVSHMLRTPYTKFTEASEMMNRFGNLGLCERGICNFGSETHEASFGRKTLDSRNTWFAEEPLW